MIDFTDCRIIPGRTYNGANGSKIAISYDGEIYAEVSSLRVREAYRVVLYQQLYQRTHCQQYIQHAGDSGTGNMSWQLHRQRKTENRMCLQGLL